VSLSSRLAGALVMGPMTKGSNLPYRRLCVEFGARVTVSEMTVVRRLRQRRMGEFALTRRFDGEPCFGVQLASTNPEELAWAAALVEARGADFVDLNCGCPIDHFTHKGIGASLGRQPSRQRRLVEAMKKAVSRISVTAKIRLGWNDDMRNYLEQARAAVDGGADAVAVHGRTRNARYRTAADWDAIGEVAAALPVPVVGNGDVLFGHEADGFRARAGCAAVMTARAALIRPWIFREATEGYRDLSAEDRVAVYRRYATLARAHWGDDAHGLERVRTFTRWHLDFWCRDARRRDDGTFPSMQVREPDLRPRSALEALLGRTDAAAHDYLAECLTYEREIEPDAAPPPAPAGEARHEPRLSVVEG
jgi:tRNA-dihydrouridine synthase 3